MTYREMRAILRRFGYELQERGSNQADLVRLVERRRGLLRREVVVEPRRIGTVGYHSDREQIAIAEIKKIRRLAGLTEEDGCDSNSFYAGADQFDVFINEYRTILRRLARH